MRRFRLMFSKGEPVRYISHLDLMRTWERSLRRAGVRLAHTEGYNPRPRLIFAAPLQVGVTSDAEIVDVIVEGEPTAEEFRGLIEPSVAPGIRVLDVCEVEPHAPPLMANVASADYVLTLANAVDLARLRAFLGSVSAPYQRSRKGGIKTADMRPAVLDLWQEGERQLGMRLRLDVEGLGVRPEEVLKALDPGWEALRIHRTKLHLKQEAHAA
ncbi:MAG: TIGR03936 family radical SAM-associated protein [Chloroflexota bacterium]